MKKKYCDLYCVTNKRNVLAKRTWASGETLLRKNTQKDNLNTEQEIRIGDSYIAGVYMVEVMQGNNRKVVKLVKQ